MEFNGMRWFVEGDIKGCFDNIDHDVLVELIHSKIKDARIIKLIYKFLKSRISGGLEIPQNLQWYSARRHYITAPCQHLPA